MLAALLGTAFAVCYTLIKYFPWIKYDFKSLWVILKYGVRIRRIRKNKIFVADQFEEHAKRQPDKTFVIFEGKHYSYREVEKRANKLGNALCLLGIRQGDAVALFEYNSIDFVTTYLALAKLGAPIVMLNYNQRSTSLLHSIKVSETEFLIIGNSDELVLAVKDIQGDLENQNLDIYVFGKHDLPEGMEPLEPILESAVDDPVIHGLRENVKFADPFCYIYTSGTTGLPKAALISNWRALTLSVVIGVNGMTKNGIIYTTLPLYHSAGVLMGLGAAIQLGATMVLRKKFSASNFFKDCIEHKVTVIQYIGEMCRFLLATPSTDQDQQHCVRMAFGNGLRKDIWSGFQTRFGIPNIVEFYGSTEGNGGTMNVNNKVGAVGRVSPLFTAIFPFAMVKYDFEKREAIRDENGRCIKSGQREAALLIGEIKKNNEFNGYKGPKEHTNKKIMRDVFKKGDAWYNTGDLMTRDEDYFLYFADRTGDTFRWRGENVSCTEVANRMTQVSWVEDANVYGVEVQGYDGKAGMAAITKVQGHHVTEDDLQQLYDHCEKVLPNYAIPRFIRIEEESDITSTYKLSKISLVKDSFDPSKAQGHAIYIMDSSKTFIPLTASVYQDVNNGTLRL